MTVLRGLAVLVLTCAVCAAGLTGARGEFGLSADEEDRDSGSENTASPLGPPPAVPHGLEAMGRISACLEKECPQQCTGFLIGPDLFVTSAHCVKVHGGNWYDPARIRFHSSTHPAVRVTEYVHVGDYQNADAEALYNGPEPSVVVKGQDIAILRLEERLGDKLGWLPKGKVDWDELAGGGEYEVAGIPGDKLFHLKSCRLHPEAARWWTGPGRSLHSAFKRGLFFHTCNMRQGFSGGPFMRRENGKLTWIGVTSSGMTLDEPGHHKIDGASMTAILLPNGEPAPFK